MKIGFDAKRAAQNRTGLGNYSRFIIRILSEQHPELSCHLYVPNPHRMPYLPEIATLPKLHLHFPPRGFWSRLRSLWRVWGMTGDIHRDGIDIFHGLSNELPLNTRPQWCHYVVTVHDLIFLHTPQYYHWIDRKIYDFKFRRACHRADRVIAVSEFTKKEIMHYYHTPADKIDVVYQGCDPVFARPVAADKLAEVKSRYGLPDRFVLYVGSIEERKNLMLIAKALATMGQREDIHVVAVGRRTPYVEQVKAYLDAEGITQRFHFCHQVPYDDLPAFYRLARTFAYPSRIEGFGIPLLEAITSGLPAIGCTGSCLEEAGGPGSIYVDPDDAQAMARAITATCDDEDLRRRMIEQGHDYAQRFSDERLCSDLMEVYRRCCGATQP